MGAAAYGLQLTSDRLLAKGPVHDGPYGRITVQKPSGQILGGLYHQRMRSSQNTVSN